MRSISILCHSPEFFFFFGRGGGREVGGEGLEAKEGRGGGLFFGFRWKHRAGVMRRSKSVHVPLWQSRTKHRDLQLFSATFFFLVSSGQGTQRYDRNLFCNIQTCEQSYSVQ